MRKGIVANNDIKKLDKIKRSDIIFARPATEYNSYVLNKIVGKRVHKNIKKSQQIKKFFFKKK